MDLHIRCLGAPSVSGRQLASTARQIVPLIHSMEHQILIRDHHARRFATRASPDQVPDDSEGGVMPDWRQFRADLIARTAAENGDAVGPDSTVWSSRWSEQNLYLLQQQDRKLAQEGLWAHATQFPEEGGLLLAAPIIEKNQPEWQLVIVLLQHGVKDFVRVAWTKPFERKPGNCSGIYTGGAIHGAQEVLEGKLSTTNFRFFAGFMEWGPGALENEIRIGKWITAACSRSLVLKQCLKLPVPLWREIMCLMGEPYATQSRSRFV